MASTEAVSFYGPSASRREMFAAADPPYRFLSPHQAAVLDAATYRLAPRPDDVVSYLDRRLWLSGPRFRVHYITGLALLDRQAGGDFTSVPPLRQDFILSQRQLASFTNLLFGHIIDAVYAVPRHVNRCDDASRIATGYFSTRRG